MRSGGNNFNYFPDNKLTKLANYVQFIRMLIFCLENWGDLGYATVAVCWNFVGIAVSIGKLQLSARPTFSTHDTTRLQ